MPRRAAVRHVVRDANLGRAIERDTCIFRHSRDAVKRGSTGDGLSCGNTWATMQRLLAFRAVAFGKMRKGAGGRLFSLHCHNIDFW